MSYEALSSKSGVRLPSPVYPEVALINGVQGIVVVSIAFNIKGRVERVELIKTSGFEMLDRSVLDTVNWQWKIPKELAPCEFVKQFEFRIKE